MKPSTLVDIFRSNSYEPMLTMTQIGAKLHDHVRELIQVGPCSEILNCLVFEHAYFFGREAVHLDDFQRLSIDLTRKRELFKLAQSSTHTYQSSHIFGTLVTLILLEKLIVVIHVINIEITIGAY